MDNEPDRKQTQSHEVAEINLGQIAAQCLIQNTVSALGYRSIQQRSLSGQSGISHDFQCIAVRDKKVLLVIGGAERSQNRGSGSFNLAQRSDAWVKDCLTKYYDVTESLRTAGYKTNALLFQNVHDKFPAEIALNFIKSGRKGLGRFTEIGLPSDSNLSFTSSIHPLGNFFHEGVASIAQNMGFPYLSLNDFDYKILGSLSENSSPAAIERLGQELKRNGLHQFFYPAVDEYVLSCIDKGKLAATRLENLLSVGEDAGTEFQNAVHIANVTLRDPLSIAKELEKSKAISFESEIIVTEKGHSIRQKISCTPQESLIVKVLKSISLKSMISVALGTGPQKTE